MFGIGAGRVKKRLLKYVSPCFFVSSQVTRAIIIHYYASKVLFVTRISHYICECLRVTLKKIEKMSQNGTLFLILIGDGRTNKSYFIGLLRLSSGSENTEVIKQIWGNLNLSWRSPLSYRNQSTDLPCARDSFLIKLQALACNFIKKETLTQGKSMNWFLYDDCLPHERVKPVY